MRHLEGRFVVGRFDEVRQCTNGDGEPVRNLFEVVLLVRGADEDMEIRASFFRTDMEGGRAAIVGQIEKLSPKKGDSVAVRLSYPEANFSKKAGKAFANQSALAMYPAALVEDEVRVPVAANGKSS